MGGLHDHPGLYPTLPGKDYDPAEIEHYASEDDPFRQCWEYVLSHQLTEGEGSAFWHGANLVFAAMKDAD